MHRSLLHLTSQPRAVCFQGYTSCSRANNAAHTTTSIRTFSRGRRVQCQKDETPDVSRGVGDDDRIAKLEILIGQLQQQLLQLQQQQSNLASGTAPSTIKNTGAQVLLFMIGAQPEKASTCSRLRLKLKHGNEQLQRQFMAFSTRAFHTDAHEFAAGGDRLITNPNRTVHFRNLQQLDAAVSRAVAIVNDHRQLLEQQADDDLQYAMKLLDHYQDFRTTFDLPG